MSQLRTSNMEIQVSFLVGTDITDAIKEAKHKALIWNVAYVKFEFNQTQFSIGPYADIDKAIKSWKSGDKFVCEY